MEVELDESRYLDKESVDMEIAQSKKSRSILKAIGFGGLGVFYVAFAGQGVPHLTSLGLTESQISLTLLSGPICGAVLQPYFGSWSDRHQSPWGQRKPFIVIGAAYLIISMLCLAWARPIVDLFVSRDESNKIQQTILALFAMLFVWAMYSSVQAIQVGMRVLVTDGCSLREQAEANAWAGRYISVGGVVGNLAAFVDSRSRAAWKVEGPTTLTNMTFFVAMCLIVTLGISCFCVSSEDGNSGFERSAELRRARKAKNKNKKSSGWREQLRLLRGTSNQFRKICLVQFLSWLGWFPFYFYAVTYVNNFSISQKPQTSLWRKPKNEPPRLGSLAFLTYSAFSLLTSILLPYLTTGDRALRPAWTKKARRLHALFTMRHIWMLSHAVFALCMLGTFFVKTAQGTVVLFTIVGFSWAVTNWIPYALLGTEISRQPGGDGYKELTSVEDGESVSTHEGFIYGLHGLSICLPQIIMALCMGVVSMSTDMNSKAKSNLEIVWTFRVGGAFAFIAMFCTLWVRDLGDYGDNNEALDQTIEVSLEDRIK